MKSHDEESLDLLKQTYLSLMLYILNSFPLKYEDKEECINDVLLKVWNAKDQYLENQISLKNYIALITRRVALNYVRKKQYVFSPFEDMDIFGKEDIYENIHWDEVILKLSKKEQVLFYRKYYYFQSIETISLELGMTYKSVESYLYRLRKKLQKILKEGGYYG
ncbi:MAG: sigma-70 family RNA polymerase sigma factor [Coprobacillus sp.]